MSVGMGCDTGRVTNLLFFFFFLDCKLFSYKILWTLSTNLSIIRLLKIVALTKHKICWDDFFFFF